MIIRDPSKLPPNSALRRKIDEAMAKDLHEKPEQHLPECLQEFGKLQSTVRHKNRPGTMAKPRKKPANRASRAKLVLAKMAAGLVVKDETLHIWLPDYILPSYNTLLRANEKAQCTAKERALTMLAKCNCELWRFDKQVTITYIQYRVSRRGMDVDNIYTKAIQDAITENHGGLGIIKDDAQKYLRAVTKEQRLEAYENGLSIIIQPVRE